MPERRTPGTPSRRLPALVLVGFFVIILVEVSLLVWVSNLIGWWTLAALMVSTLLGAFLLQREWRKAWRQLSESLKTGSLPSGRTADAVLVLLGGFMLIMPGFLTDIVGLLLLLPFTRPWVRSVLGRWVGRSVARHTASPRDMVIPGDVVEPEPGEPFSGTVIPAISPSEEDREGS